MRGGQAEACRGPTAALVGLALVLSLLPAAPGGPSLAAAMPNDPYFGDFQWNLRQVRVPEAWDLTTGDRRVIIAIVDTGIALDHPDLVGKLVPGINFVTPDGHPRRQRPRHARGRHRRGGHEQRPGRRRPNWEARLMPVKVLDPNGGGDVNRVAQGIVWAVDHGARVMNLSFDGPERRQCSPTPCNTRATGAR